MIIIYWVLYHYNLQLNIIYLNFINFVAYQVVKAHARCTQHYCWCTQHLSTKDQNAPAYLLKTFAPNNWLFFFPRLLLAPSFATVCDPTSWSATLCSPSLSAPSVAPLFVSSSSSSARHHCRGKHSFITVISFPLLLCVVLRVVDLRMHLGVPRLRYSWSVVVLGI